MKEAVELYTQVLAFKQLTLGCESPEVADTENNIATLHQMESEKKERKLAKAWQLSGITSQ